MTIDSTLTQLIVPVAHAVTNNLSLPIDALSHSTILAQQFQNVDLIANMQSGWDDFLKTGKAGALVIGLVMGYLIRGITK
jgi:hypothetical protein